MCRARARAELPEHVFVSKQFQLVDNWSDADAIVQLAPTVYKCCELFADGEGPNTNMIKDTKDADFARPAMDLHGVVRAAEDQAKQGSLCEKRGLLQQSVSQRRKDSAAKARQARAKSSVERKKLRRVTLS